MKVSTLVIGMEYSYVFGQCTGSRIDSNKMFELLKPYSSSIILLQDSNATKENVVKAWKTVMDADLTIIYYSGHGGSERFETTGPEEIDGKDEYLCLEDTYLLDNEIWQLLQQSKGRVIFIADCCHSETMFRSPGFSFTLSQKLLSAGSERAPLNLQMWSGCADNTYSYGDSTGGELTKRLLKYFNANMTYDELWDKLQSDQSLKRYEIIKRTKLGIDFGDKKIFT